MKKDSVPFSGNRFWWLLLLLAAVLIAAWRIQEKKAEGDYWIGEVEVDEELGEIRFPAIIEKTDGWVQCLLYAHSYRWLRDESAIVGQVSLLDLQESILSLGLKYWKPVDCVRITSDEWVEVRIRWREDGRLREVNPLLSIVDEEVRPTLEQIIFLAMGTNIFDEKASSESLFVDCSRCLFFLPLEKKMIRDWFLLPSGKSGYHISPHLLPPRGTMVTVILRMGKKR